MERTKKQSDTQRTKLFDLPQSVLLFILSHLPGESLLEFASCDRAARKWAETPALWENLVIRNGFARWLNKEIHRKVDSTPLRGFVAKWINSFNLGLDTRKLVLWKNIYVVNHFTQRAQNQAKHFNYDPSPNPKITLRLLDIELLVPCPDEIPLYRFLNLVRQLLSRELDIRLRHIGPRGYPGVLCEAPIITGQKLMIELATNCSDGNFKKQGRSKRTFGLAPHIGPKPTTDTKESHSQGHAAMIPLRLEPPDRNFTENPGFVYLNIKTKNIQHLLLAIYQILKERTKLPLTCDDLQVCVNDTNFADCSSFMNFLNNQPCKHKRCEESLVKVDCWFLLQDGLGDPLFPDNRPLLDNIYLSSCEGLIVETSPCLVLNDKNLFYGIVSCEKNQKITHWVVLCHEVPLQSHAYIVKPDLRLAQKITANPPKINTLTNQTYLKNTQFISMPTIQTLAQCYRSRIVFKPLNSSLPTKIFQKSTAFSTPSQINPKRRNLLRSAINIRQCEFHPHHPDIVVLGHYDGTITLIDIDKDRVLGVEQLSECPIIALNWFRNSPNAGITGSSPDGRIAIFQLNYHRSNPFEDSDDDICHNNRIKHRTCKTTTFNDSLEDLLQVNQFPLTHGIQITKECLNIKHLSSISLNCTDDYFLASGASNLAVYDAHTGLHLRTYSGLHGDAINTVRFSNRSPSLFATASFDHACCLWDLRVSLQKRAPLRIFHDSDMTVMCCFDRTDSNLLVSGVGSTLTQYTLFNPKTLNFSFPDESPHNNFRRSVYLENNVTIASAGTAESHVSLFSTSGKYLGRLSLDDPSLSKSIVRLLSKTHRSIASTNRRHLQDQPFQSPVSSENNSIPIENQHFPWNTDGSDDDITLQCRQRTSWTNLLSFDDTFYHSAIRRVPLQDITPTNSQSILPSGFSVNSALNLPSLSVPETFVQTLRASPHRPKSFAVVLSLKPTPRQSPHTLSSCLLSVDLV